jgi:AcrR family transcriptional regulator
LSTIVAARRSRSAVRGRPRREAVDDAILDATEQVLARRGYEAMTIEHVAAQAGVSKPTIYLRHRSKADLVAAMIDRLRPPLDTAPTDSVATDLVALIEMQRLWVEHHGLRLVAAVLLEQEDHPELIRRFRQRVVHPARRAFRDALRRGIARGELRAGADSTEMIDALTGAYWARAWTTDLPTRRWTIRLVDAVLTGARNRGER